jgi:electron transfer flavoprotein beta subunit
MKILVAVKRVPDYKSALRIKADGSAVDTTNLKHSMNPFDEIAVEEALRLKEKIKVEEVIAVSIGTDVSQETLRSALAMGADRAVLIKTAEEIEPLAAAKILHQVIQQEQVQLVILGKQAVDTDNNQVGQMLAGYCNGHKARLLRN